MTWSTLVVDVSGVAERLDTASRTKFLTQPGSWLARLNGINRARAVWDLTRLGTAGLSAWSETGIEIQIEPDAGASGLSAMLLALEALDPDEPTTELTLLTGKTAIGPLARLAAAIDLDLAAFADTAEAGLLDDALTLDHFGFSPSRGVNLLSSPLPRANPRPVETEGAPEPAPVAASAPVAPVAASAAAAVAASLLVEDEDMALAEGLAEVVEESVAQAAAEPAEDTPALEDLPAIEIVEPAPPAEEAEAPVDDMPVAAELVIPADSGSDEGVGEVDFDDLSRDLDRALSENLEDVLGADSAGAPEPELTVPTQPDTGPQDPASAIDQEVDDLLAKLLAGDEPAGKDGARREPEVDREPEVNREPEVDADPLDSIFADLVPRRD